MSILKRFAAVACLAAFAPLAHAASPRSPYRVVQEVAGPDGGWDYVRVNPRTDQVLVTRGATVMALDLKSGKVNPEFAHGSRMHIALPVNDGREVLLTDGGVNAGVFVDAVSGAVLATVPTGKGPDSAGLEPRSGLVLIADHSGGDITVVDPRTHKATGSIQVGGDLEEVAVDGAGRAFVNVEDKNQIAVLDPVRRAVLARYALPGCDGPTGLAYDAADDRLIAACDGSTVIVAAKSGKVIRTLATGKGADGVALDAKRRLAFVPAGHDGTLSVIQLTAAGGDIVQTLATRRSARTIGIDPRTGRIYLPSAEYLPAAAGERPKTKPGSFRLLVVAP